MDKKEMLREGLRALATLHAARAMKTKSKKAFAESTETAAAALALHDAMAPIEKLPTECGIKMFWHCKECLRTRPEDQSPADWARLSVGFTQEGLQVWCWRHGINVAHVHFEGFTHPANMGAGKPDAENRSERRNF